MKRHRLLLLLAVCQIYTVTAQKKDPKWLDRANKAIFTVEATTKAGTTRTGPGFFIQENGEAIASYELFRNAGYAVVITTTGERLPVLQIMGADDMYNVIRFKVAKPKKISFLPVAPTSPALNSTVYLPPSKEENKLSQGVITEITKINSIFDYFKVAIPQSQSQVGLPLLTETGEVFALTQIDASGKGNTYGISVAYIQSLHANATDMFKRTYTELGIRLAWASIDQAQIALMLYASLQDAPTYLETLNDFITSFPNDAEGYVNRASHYAFRRKELATTENEQLQLLDKAWNDLESAAKLFKNKGDGFYHKAKLMYGIIGADSLLSYKNWNLKTVGENIQKAIKESNLPAYRHLEGELAFIQQDYAKAYASFMMVNESPESTGTSFYLAAKSKLLLDGTNLLEIIALIDSAVTKSPPQEAAVYLLENIDFKIQMGLYDAAVSDYNTYYLFSGGNVTDAFYFYRHEAKFRAGDLDGALKDIEMAITIDKTNALFFAGKASIHLRLNDIVKAQESAEKAIELEPDFASAYRLLGVCLVRQEKKAEACPHLNKAKELGDPVAERLIKENCM